MIFAVITILIIIQVSPANRTAAAKGSKRPSVEYVPDSSSPGSPVLEGASWVVEHERYTARLTRLDDAGRRAFLVEKAGAFTDPFASTDPRSVGFLTFLLELESRTEGTLVFQPQNCILVTNRKEFRYPLDLPTIESSFGLLEQEVPQSYRQARPALFDGERVLLRGERASGLLVYRGIDAKTRSFVVEFQLTTPQGKVVGFTSTYKRLKKKNKKKEAP